MANIGHQLKEEIERVLTMISQFAFIHGDTNLLCLALLRRPPEPPLTLGKVVDTKCFKTWTCTVQPCPSTAIRADELGVNSSPTSFVTAGQRGTLKIH